MKYDFKRKDYQDNWMRWICEKGSNRMGNFSKTGTGKTVMSIDWLNKMNFLSILIVCPKSAMKHTWYDAVKDNLNADTITICKGSKSKRRDQMEHHMKHGFKSVFIINYDIIDKHKFELSNMGFDCVVFDESHKLGGQSARAKAAMQIARVDNNPEFMGCLLLSGTPSNEDLMDYYNQMVLIGGRKKSSFNKWRANNFNAYTIPDTHITTYTPKDGFKEKLLNDVSMRTFTAAPSDLKGMLPDRFRSILSVPMSKDQRIIYDSLMNNYTVSINNREITVDSNAALATKMLQISSGFIYDNNKNAINISDNRIKLMSEALESFGKDEQCIIWYAYKHQRESICKKLKCESYSSLSDKNKVKYIDDFISGKNKYFVAHPKSCGESITLVNCNHEIWYCLNGALRAWMQAGDRIYRLGQTKDVVSVTLMSENSYDEDVYNNILNGFDNDKLLSEFFKKGNFNE